MDTKEAKLFVFLVSVRRQRSNQLSYVPSAIPIAERKSQILLSLLPAHSFALSKSPPHTTEL